MLWSFGISLLNLKYIPYILLERSAILGTSTGGFSNSTNSKMSNQHRAIRREYQPVGLTLLKNLLAAGRDLLSTLWWVVSWLLAYLVCLFVFLFVFDCFLKKIWSIIENIS